MYLFLIMASSGLGAYGLASVHGFTAGECFSAGVVGVMFGLTGALLRAGPR